MRPHLKTLLVALLLGLTAMAWLGTWAKRKAIKYGTVFPASNLTAFSKLLVVNADADIYVESHQAGYFAVTLADGTTSAPWGELNRTEAGATTTFAWRAKFDLNSAASTGDILGYLYYDHTQTSGLPDRPNAFDSNVKVYWPLEENPSTSAPQILDWTTVNDGTSHGSMTSGDLVAAQVSNGLDFDGSDDYIQMASGIQVGAGAFTFTGIYKATGSGLDLQKVWMSGNNLSDNRGIQIGFNSSNSIWAYIDDNSANADLSSGTNNVDGNFHHVAVTRNGATVKLYVDGSQVATTTSGPTGDVDTAGAETYIGGGQTTKPAAVIADEFSFAFTDRNADWIAYDYQDQFNNSDTFTLGAEETMPVAGQPLLDLAHRPHHQAVMAM